MKNLFTTSEFKSINLNTTKINGISITELLPENVDGFKPIILKKHISNNKLYFVLSKNGEVIPHKHNLTFYVYCDTLQCLDYHDFMCFDVQPTRINLNHAINVLYNKYVEKSKH